MALAQERERELSQRDDLIRVLTQTRDQALATLQRHGLAQPRPQGLLAFQYGGGSGEDPGTQQITCLQRGWRCIQNGG